MSATGHTQSGPMAAPSPFRRRLAVIMAADVAGYSRLLATDEEEALALFHDCRRLFEAEVTRFGGRVFNTAGDAIMSEFTSSVEAVRAAMAIQRALEALNAGYPVQRRILFRIGISVGDVVEDGDDLLGNGVNIASRLEGIARPGGICVSRGVYDTVMGKISARFRELGPTPLKNIPHPVEAFAIIPDGEDSQENSQENGARAAATPAAGEARAQRNPARMRARRWRRHGLSGPPRPPLFRGRLWRRLTQILLVTIAISLAVPTIRLVRQQLEIQLGLRPATSRLTAPPQAGPADRNAAARAAYERGRLLESQGRADSASVAYTEAARAGYVDPPVRLAALIRARDGADAAREALADLAAMTKDQAARMVYLQQLGAAERIPRLQRMTEEAPDFAPAWFAFAMALDDGRSMPPTLARMQAGKHALEAFLDRVRRGAARRYFLDDGLLNEWTARAEARLSELDAALAGRNVRPALTFAPSARGLTVTVTLPEDATDVRYRVGDHGNYTRADPGAASGAGVRSASFTLPAPAGRIALQVTYTDVNGITAGPFDYSFDPEAHARTKERAVLLATSGSWVTWATDRDELFFPYLLSHRCAIRSASVGFDGAPPETALPLPKEGCDKGSPPPAGAQNSIPVPHDARSVTVRLVLANGDAAPDVTIAREP